MYKMCLLIQAWSVGGRSGLVERLDTVWKEIGGLGNK